MEAVRVLGVDPGTDESAFALFDGVRVIDHDILPNPALLQRLRLKDFGGPFLVVIEQIESFGMAVGASVFETVFWSGRFAQAAGAFARVPRKTVKLHLCQSLRAKDANIRQALLDRFGGKEKAIGRRGAYGPLHGMASHRWAALAVAVTYWDQHYQEGR